MAPITFYTEEATWQGSVMVMKNDDVYTIVNDSSYSTLSLLGVKVTRNSLPFIPVKIVALCGIEIRGMNEHIQTSSVIISINANNTN